MIDCHLWSSKSGGSRKAVLGTGYFCRWSSAASVGTTAMPSRLGEEEPEMVVGRRSCFLPCSPEKLVMPCKEKNFSSFDPSRFCNSVSSPSASSFTVSLGGGRPGGGR